MNVWMYECIEERMKGWMNEWMNSLTGVNALKFKQPKKLGIND